MTEIHVSNEQERIQALAEQYRSQGYEVVVRPAPHTLPAFLSGYRPDLTATRDGETTVVDVKTRRSLAVEAWTQELARIIEEHPGWRFELVLLNDLKAGPPEGSVAFDSARAHRALDEGRALLASGYVGPAMLGGWAALEAALRLLLASEGVSPRSLATIPLLTQSVEEGLVSREDYRTLRSLMAGRNAIAHGYENETVTSEAVAQLLDLADRLLDEASAPESA